MGDRTHFVKGADRLDDAVDNQLRRNVDRKVLFFGVAVHMADTRLGPRNRGGMEQAEANPIALKGRMGLASQRTSDRTIRRADQHSLPDKVNVGELVGAGVADLEMIISDRHLHSTKLIGRRVPITVADGDIEPAYNFVFTQFEIA